MVSISNSRCTPKRPIWKFKGPVAMNLILLNFPPPGSFGGLEAVMRIRFALVRSSMCFHYPRCFHSGALYLGTFRPDALPEATFVI